MKTIDIHLVRRLVVGYLTLIGVLIVCFVLFHYVEYVDDFFSKGATSHQVFLQYYPNYLPEIIKLISPLALFLAAVFLTTKLTEELQITALQASGISLKRLFIPYMVVGMAVTVVMFWFNGFLVPETNRFRLDFEERFFKETGRRIDTNNLHRQNAPGSVLTVRFFDDRTVTAHQTSLQQYDEQNRLLRRVDAQEMRWIDSTGSWRLEFVSSRTFEEGREKREFRDRVDTLLNILPRDLARKERDVEALTIPQARQYIDSIERAGVSDRAVALVQYLNKYAYPMANVVVVLLAFPMGAVRNRRGKTVQIGVALFVAFVYLSAMRLVEPLGFAGDLSPAVTAWGPHVLFAALGMFMLDRVQR